MFTQIYLFTVSARNSVIADKLRDAFLQYAMSGLTTQNTLLPHMCYKHK